MPSATHRYRRGLLGKKLLLMRRGVQTERPRAAPDRSRPGCQGWQRPRRLRASQPPRSTPKRRIACERVLRAARIEAARGPEQRAQRSTDTGGSGTRRGGACFSDFLPQRREARAQLRAGRAARLGARTHHEVDRRAARADARGRTRGRCAGCGCGRPQPPATRTATASPRRARARIVRASLSRQRIRHPCAARVRRPRRNRVLRRRRSRAGSVSRPGIGP